MERLCLAVRAFDEDALGRGTVDGGDAETGCEAVVGADYEC